MYLKNNITVSLGTDPVNLNKIILQNVALPLNTIGKVI